jgi:Domain of unknown function (DUF4421)
MDQYLTFRVSMNNDVRGFVIKNVVRYDIKPNDKNLLKFSVNYRWFSFSYSTAPKFIPGNNDDELKGETKTRAYSLNFNFNHWIQGLSYNYVKGYYLNNTSIFVNPWVEGVDPYIQFPDLVYNNFSGRTAYKFNKNFSFNAIGPQTERQLISAGSFVPAIAYNYYTINDKTALTGQNSSQ